MKLGKKLLAVALAGVLALSVLTGCAGSGSINGKKLAKILTIDGISVEYDSSLNKTAENAMKAVKAKVDGKTITMENAIDAEKGTLLCTKEKTITVEDKDEEGNVVGTHPKTIEVPSFTEAGAGLKNALKVDTENKDKIVHVALVDTKDLTGETFALAMAIGQNGVEATENGYFYDVSNSKLGYFTSGSYTMFVIIGEVPVTPNP